MRLVERVGTARLAQFVSVGLLVVVAVLAVASQLDRGSDSDSDADPASDGSSVTYALGSETSDGGPGTIAVIGDSITNGARAQMAAELGDPRFVHVSAKPLDLYRDRFDEAEQIAATDPEVVVVHLGTNDWWCGFANKMENRKDCRYPDFEWEDEVTDAETMISTFPDDTCILLTQVWEADVVVDPVNDLLESLVDEGAIEGFVPWQDYLLGLSEEDRASLMAEDGIGHLTTAGSQALAELTRLAVDQYCPSQGAD